MFKKVLSDTQSYKVVNFFLLLLGESNFWNIDMRQQALMDTQSVDWVPQDPSILINMFPDTTIVCPALTASSFLCQAGSLWSGASHTHYVVT